MINVAKLTRDTIIVNNITDEAGVSNYTIDDHFREKTNKPIICIYPLLLNPDTYADDDETSREYHYQIDVWWSQGESNEQIERIIELLKVINFQCYYREPLYESDVMSFRHIIRAKGSILSVRLEENQMIKKLKQTPRFLKLNSQHSADTEVSGIAIGVPNPYYAPISKNTGDEWETRAGIRIHSLKETEVDRLQDIGGDYGDDMVAVAVTFNGELSVKTTFVAAPADGKAFLNSAKKGIDGYKYGAKDIPPDVAIVFERHNHDESPERISLFKGKFIRLSIKGQTKQGKAESQNDNAEGNFINRLSDESSYVTGYDKKGSITGHDYIFMETSDKIYGEFMSSRGEQYMKPVEKEMKRIEKVEVTSVNITNEQVTVKADATKQLLATTGPPGRKAAYAVTEGQTCASVTSTGLVKGLAKGNAIVTATAGKQTGTVQITVQSNLEM